MRVGAIPFDAITAHCVIDSVPPVNKFYWTYNTTSGVFPVHASYIESKGNSSIVHFPEDSQEEVESLQCWAENDVGKQDVPCYFIVIPAGRCYNKLGYFYFFYSKNLLQSLCYYLKFPIFC